MKKLALVMVGIFIGATAGYFGVEYMLGHPDRAKVATEMFEKYCVPFARQETVLPGPELVNVPHLRSEQFWLETRSKIALFITANRCTVTDVLEPMNKHEREVLEKAIDPILKASLPMLSSETPQWPPDWDSYKIWSEHRSGDPRYWAVTLIRVSPDGPDSSTILAVALALPTSPQN